MDEKVQYQLESVKNQIKVKSEEARVSRKLRWFSYSDLFNDQFTSTGKTEKTAAFFKLQSKWQTHSDKHIYCISSNKKQDLSKSRPL